MKISDEWKWLLILAVVCGAVYANSLNGEFVYDDTRQLVRNPLIQQNALIGKALTSDVWAFKGDGTQTASNYWRPTFTAWNIICYRLFGASPFGWHVASLLLHIGVTLLAFSLLRRWQFSAAAAFVISLIFAIHPTKVESVAWIAGSPDLLFSLFFLASLWFTTSYRESKSTNHLVLVILFYALSLGAKEIGILLLPIYYLVLRETDETKQKKGWMNLPLAILFITAATYFLARLKVIGRLSFPTEGSLDLATSLITVPKMFAFYVMQTFFPATMAANYTLEPVTQIEFGNFFVPILMAVGFIVLFVYLARETRYGFIGLALFFLPLIPAMNATAFHPDQLVHDRYLYLPLLGLLMVVVPFIEQYLDARKLIAAGAVTTLALAFVTFNYNRAWANELALWEWTSKVDDSAFTWAQYGSVLNESARNEESIEAYTNSLKKRITARGYLGRSRALIAQERYAEAEGDLARMLDLPGEDADIYALYQAFEALGIVYLGKKDYASAERNFRSARARLPIYSAALTEKLAIVLYQKGDKPAALIELEGAKDKALTEMLPESKSVFLRLGMLYAEQNRVDEARSTLQNYLNLTSTIKSPSVLRDREQAVAILQKLR